MPKYPQKNHHTQPDSLDTNTQKSVRFNMTPNQLDIQKTYQTYEARLASYDEALEFETFDDDSSLSSDDDASYLNDDVASICSDDFNDLDTAWSDIAVYGKKLETALSNLTPPTIKNHVVNPRPWIDNAHQERPALYAKRANLNSHLNNIINKLEGVLTEHQETNEFPAVINRLQNTLSQVQANLNRIVPQPAYVTDEQKLRSQAHNIASAALTLQGALLSEIETPLASSNALNQALSAIVAEMGTQEKSLARNMYGEFKQQTAMKHDFSFPHDHSERASLYARRASLNDYLSTVKNSVLEFITAHQQTSTQPTAKNEFFSTATAPRLQKTINDVQANLDKIIAQPSTLTDESRLRMQQVNIAKAILTIKGAMLSELDAIGNTQKSSSEPANEAFVSVITGMSQQEKVLALNLYDNYKMDTTLNASVDNMTRNQHPQRAGLYKQRAHLVADLNSFQKELKQLPADYQKQKASAAAKNLNSFFGTGKAPEPHRLDAIERIQKTAALVQSQLDEIVPRSENITDEEKLRNQIKNLKQGILAIKGAVITEFDSIKGSIFSSERSSLHVVLNKNYALSDMKPVEKAQAIKAFQALEMPEVEQVSSMSA